MEAILNPGGAKRLWFSLKMVCLFIMFKINPKTLRFLNGRMLVLVYPWWQVNHVSGGQSEPAPTSTPVGCSVHRIGWVAFLHLVPDLVLTNIVPQLKFLGCWPLPLFVVGCFFLNPNHTILQPSYPKFLTTLLT